MIINTTFVPETTYNNVAITSDIKNQTAIIPSVLSIRPTSISTTQSTTKRTTTTTAIKTTTKITTTTTELFAPTEGAIFTPIKFIGPHS